MQAGVEGDDELHSPCHRAPSNPAAEEEGMTVEELKELEEKLSRIEERVDTTASYKFDPFVYDSIKELVSINRSILRVLDKLTAE